MRWGSMAAGAAVEEPGASPGRSRHCHRGADPFHGHRQGRPGRASIREPGDSGRAMLSPHCGRGHPRKGPEHAGVPERVVIPPFPFSAIVGLADLRLALLLNAVSPAIGRVLVPGDKGTAKSTMARALAALLPDVTAVAGCRFGCDPAVPDGECPDGP